MLTIRFFAFLGALMGLYAAAALQNGPDIADANLCKLARRFSGSVPEQCIPSLDDYGTAAAIIFGVACLILLLWDFKAAVRARCAQMIGWGRPRIIRASAKVEPHLILVGLFVALIGMAIIGYGVWRKPRPTTASTVEQSDPSRPSMLSGRKISGLEVVTRLERLEAEHSATVLELAATKQQLDTKHRELETAKVQYPGLAAAGTKFAEAVKPILGESPTVAKQNGSILLANRYYAPKNKDEVAGLLDRISESISKTGNRVSEFAEIAINRSPWDRPGENIEPFVKRMDDISALTVQMHIALYDELVAKEREYRVEVNSILFPKEPFTNFQVECNEFRNALSVWMNMRDKVDNADKQGLLRMVHASRMTFGTVRDRFVGWLDKRRELVDQARRELRS
jgi:hypothetical protein